MEKTKVAYVEVRPDLTEVEKAKSKVDELNDALEKANFLLDQLANKGEITLHLNFVYNRD